MDMYCLPVHIHRFRHGLHNPLVDHRVHTEYDYPSKCLYRHHLYDDVDYVCMLLGVMRPDVCLWVAAYL